MVLFYVTARTIIKYGFRSSAFLSRCQGKRIDMHMHEAGIGRPRPSYEVWRILNLLMC